jgi:hypothetical protein
MVLHTEYRYDGNTFLSGSWTAHSEAEEPKIETWTMSQDVENMGEVEFHTYFLRLLHDTR